VTRLSQQQGRYKSYERAWPKHIERVAELHLIGLVTQALADRDDGQVRSDGMMRPLCDAKIASKSSS
jgi:hypothetical protein